MITWTLFACGSGDNTHIANNQRKEPCHCEKTFGTDSIVFATNVQLKNEVDGKVLRFHCSSIERGIASISNENEQYIYDINCVSTVEHSLELSKDFKYFTEAMQSQEDFFKVLKGGEKLFFEFTLEDRKIRSVLKLNID